MRQNLNYLAEEEGSLSTEELQSGTVMSGAEFLQMELEVWSG